MLGGCAKALLGPEDEQEKIGWTRFRRFQRKIRNDPRGEAYGIAKNRQGQENTVWTDGSRR